MKEKQSEKCACDKPEIKDQFPRGCCSLNQIIKLKEEKNEQT